MKNLVTLLIVVSICTVAPAANIYWTGAVDNDWQNVGNWNANSVVPDRVPITGDHALITAAAGSVPTIDDLTDNGAGGGIPWGISMGWNGGSVNIALSAGGDYQAHGQMYIGNSAVGTGVSNMYVINGSNLFGNGLQIGHVAGSIGRLHVDGGTAGTNYLTAHNAVASMIDVSAGGSFTITDLFQPTAFWTALVDGWIGSGAITANNGTAVPTYSIVDGDVVIVPEPATMVLLGLGGLLLRRKKA